MPTSNVSERCMADQRGVRLYSWHKYIHQSAERGSSFFTDSFPTT